MTVKRVMGTETEYAVSLNTPDRYNPVQLSFDVVNGAADSHSKSIRWDYRQEDPVNDARGTRLERAAAHPDLLTDAPQLNITNVIAPNGGRIYVDHAHPEYSAPETTDPFEAVREGDHKPAQIVGFGGRGWQLGAGAVGRIHQRPVTEQKNHVVGLRGTQALRSFGACGWL